MSTVLVVDVYDASMQGEEPVAETSVSTSDPAVGDNGDATESIDELIEKLDAFGALVRGDEVTADNLLDELGGHGKVETDIVTELAAFTPLQSTPEAFDSAHRLVMKSLEVLKRNGARSPDVFKRLGPLRGIGRWVVQLFTRLIVQNHLTRLSNNLRHLYGRREAWAVPGTPQMVSLKKARMQVDRLGADYKGRALGLPTFLLGGAVVSSALGGLRAAANRIVENRLLVVVATVFLLLFLIGAAWCVLRAAAVARRRIRLTTDRPMRALYDAVGSCGNPPKDDAFQFALYSLIGMALAWVVIPVGIFLVVT